MKFLDNEQREQIGFSFVMNELEITTFYGTEEKKLIKPYKVNEVQSLQQELEDIGTLIKAMKDYPEEFAEIGRIFCKVKDIKASISRCKEKDTLDEVELYEIKYFSILSEELMELTTRANLSISRVKFNSLVEPLRVLNPQKERMSTFYIYEEYSENLRDIRELKRQKEKQIFASNNEDEIAKLKQQRLDLVILEEEEELRIRKELTLRLSDYAINMEENIKSIGILDLLTAKAKLAIKYDCVKPSIIQHMDISLKGAFNPEIKNILTKKRKEFTPVTLDLKGGTTVITGANMGGKTVALKTIVLNLILGQMGFYVFAKEASFPVLDFIHFVSDDMQSISKGLSTFGAEIIKMKEVVECVKRGNGFVALDEFARGTNPKEGYYLVKSLATYLTKYQTVSIISTHYDGVVEDNMDHYQVTGLKNVDFESLKYKIDLNKTHSVEIIQEHMEYKLERVSKENKVPKDALNIAMLLGLEKEIVNIAKTYYDEEDNHGK